MKATDIQWLCFIYDFLVFASCSFSVLGWFESQKVVHVSPPEAKLVL